MAFSSMPWPEATDVPAEDEQDRMTYAAQHAPTQAEGRRRSRAHRASVDGARVRAQIKWLDDRSDSRPSCWPRPF